MGGEAGRQTCGFAALFTLELTCQAAHSTHALDRGQPRTIKEVGNRIATTGGPDKGDAFRLSAPGSPAA